MPIDYKKYPSNWKSEIRPAILERAGHKCEFCNVPNYKMIIRGIWNGDEAYQDDSGDIFDARTSVKIGEDYVGEVDETGKNPLIKVVLTIAHLDHDVTNNNFYNLKALCQRCHNRHDIEYRKSNRNKKQFKLL